MAWVSAMVPGHRNPEHEDRRGTPIRSAHATTDGPVVLARFTVALLMLGGLGLLLGAAPAVRRFRPAVPEPAPRPAVAATGVG